jgi:isopenicillin N synthase-like dioxygenase
MADYQAPARALTPILDIADWRSGRDKATVARQFDRICRTIGFFYLTGHGIAPATMQGMLDQTARFFALDDAIKKTALVDWRRRGYEPFGLQSLDATAPPDIKESLLLGLNQADDHPYVKRRLANYGPNRWPTEQQLPGFRAFCEDYLTQVFDVGRILMSIFATVAGLPEDHFEPILVDPMATLRLIHYPPQPNAVVDNQIGCGMHTDWGAVTLLLQDETGGLEVQDASGEWLYANPLEGAYVVNIGDMMPVWTNGAYYSNPHRVRNAHPERHRYSVPLFIDPDYDAVVSCLDAFLPPGESPKMSPRTVGQHIDLMYAISYGQAAPEAMANP